MNTCKICNNGQNNTIYLAKEMMFGFRDKFRYLKCNNCGCLQLMDELSDPSKYYPERYYSYKNVNVSRNNEIKNTIERMLTNYSLQSYSPGYYFLSKLFGIHHYCKWLRTAQVQHNYRILDIGCGSGDKLLTLHRLGYRHLYGIDPYINDTIVYANGVTVYKKHITELDDKYDFLMMHHSFEHMPDQLHVLQTANMLLKEQRLLLIRIPIVSSYAWKEYGVDWVQLDAPRHLYLHTERSIALLAKQSGFSIQSVYFDSSEFQFWGSEQYKKDIALDEAKSYTKNPDQSIFTKTRIKYYKNKAKILNKTGEGDSACFFLYKQ